MLQTKSFAFALRMVKMYRHLCKTKKEFILSKQLIRSGTSVAAMIREAKHAESRNDFTHKLAIAQKEMNESIFWIELLHAGGYLKRNEFQSIFKDADEVMRLLTAIIKTTKANNSKL